VSRPRFFEGYFILGRSYPWIVSIVVARVLSPLVANAMLALRKLPIDYGQYRECGLDRAQPVEGTP